MDLSQFWFQSAGGGGFPIGNSLRFRGAQFLARTPTVTGNQQTWTFSLWLKRGKLGTKQNIFNPRTGGDEHNENQFCFLADDRLQIYDSGGNWMSMKPSQVFRDPSAWFHFVAVSDTGNATQAERIRLFINGERVTAFDTATYPALNRPMGWNRAVLHEIGRYAYGSSDSFDGYMAEFHNIDGTALAPENFGEYNNDGVWVPKEVTDLTYGTNGFYLDFSDPNDIGADRSGNGNSWTATGFELTNTSDHHYDWMEDSPTDNFGTFNPLCVPGTNGTALDGNLHVSSTATSSGSTFTGSIPISTQGSKWYWEYYVGTWYDGYPILTCWTTAYTGDNIGGGVCGMSGKGTQYKADGTFLLNELPGYTTGDICMFAYDPSNGNIWMGKNGTWFLSGDPAAGTNPTDTATATQQESLFPAVSLYNGASCVVNYGQRPFAHTPPEGFEPLSTAELSAVAITNPSRHFQTVLGTGANILSSAQSTFSNGLWWIKDRANSNQHQLVDSVRGGNEALNCPGLSTASYVAPSGNSAAWCWNAAGAPVENTDGSITTQVAANTAAGFSIMTFTAGTDATAQTMGHGLDKAPEFVISKSRTDNSKTFPTYHKDAGLGYLLLNADEPFAAVSTYWGTVTDSTIGYSSTVGRSNRVGDMVYYCWHSVPGYSSIGSYVGNGDADGPFVYTGFAPAFLLIGKTSPGAGWNWQLRDRKRPGYNVNNNELRANSSVSELSSSTETIDFLSNGFKPRSANGATNESGYTYIYMAFAEHPFGGSNVSPAPAR